MKNNLISKKIISIVLIALLVITTKVYAAGDKFNTTISASSSSIKRGQNLTIIIGLKDIAIESGEKGIGAYTAGIKFDSSVLEYDSTDGSSKWEAPFYQNGLIVGNTKDGEVVNTNQSIGTITFKVKEDAKLGETTISLTNFSGSTAESDVSTTDRSVKVTIEAKEDSGNKGDDDKKPSDGDNNGDNSGDKPDSGNNNGDNNNDKPDSGNNNGGNNNDKPDSGNNGNNNNDKPSNGNNNGNNNRPSDGNNNDNNNSDNGSSDSDNSSEKENNTPKDTTNTVLASSNNLKQEDTKPDRLPKTGKTNIMIYAAIGIFILLGIIFFIKMKSLNKKIK